MIRGFIGRRDAPYIRCRVVFPRFTMEWEMDFLLDTGADHTCIHPTDAIDARIPFDLLQNEVSSSGVGGGALYYLERAFLVFQDDAQTRIYDVQLLIARPTTGNRVLPSLLGRDIINRWSMLYDPTNGRLECLVRQADLTL